MKSATCREYETGLTMIELMIALSLGLFVILSATGLLLSGKAAYLAQDQNAQVQETGPYAIEMLSRSIRQAGYENRDGDGTPIRRTADFSPDIMGMDARSLKRTGPALAEAASSATVHGSDVLALRFFGDGEVIVNCAGLIVPAPASQQHADEARGWSIFYVARDSGGEPELRCKYRSQKGWSADAIARGVESFQVLYGVDVDGDGLADRFINANDLDALDDAMPLTGENALARAADKNRRTYWKRIRSIRVSLLIRSEQTARTDVPREVHYLFGRAYGRSDDKGTRIDEKNLPPAVQKRIRKVFTQTILLRNDIGGSAP
ncbi:PilW family protein [Herminiimonas glaciei]|uniref:PilW family protein n=1 Tax=Herminiimonas glaciei TaxID=523788 RepID=A0ABW2I6Y9_9BURK